MVHAAGRPDVGALSGILPRLNVPGGTVADYLPGSDSWAVGPELGGEAIPAARECGGVQRTLPGRRRRRRPASPLPGFDLE